MKIVVPLNRHKTIFKNDDYFLKIKTSTVNKEYDNLFYGEIGKLLYAGKHNLIKDDTCGFITDKTYFKMISDDMSDADYSKFKLNEKITMITSPLKHTPEIENYDMSLKEEISCFLCNSIIEGLKEDDYDSSMILELLNDINNEIESYLTDEQKEIFNSSCVFIDTNIFISSNEEFYKYSSWLDEILKNIKSLKSFKKFKKIKTIPSENKKIGEFLSKRLLTIYLYKKEGVVPQAINS